MSGPKIANYMNGRLAPLHTLHRFRLKGQLCGDLRDNNQAGFFVSFFCLKGRVPSLP